MAYIYLSSAIIFTATSQFLLKYSLTHRRWPYLFCALLFFALVPLLSFFALKTLELSTVYISTALTQVLVLILARLGLKEEIQRQKIMGICLIVVGIIIFSL